MLQHAYVALACPDRTRVGSREIETGIAHRASPKAQGRTLRVGGARKSRFATTVVVTLVAAVVARDTWVFAGSKNVERMPARSWERVVRLVDRIGTIVEAPLWPPPVADGITAVAVVEGVLITVSAPRIIRQRLPQRPGA